MAEIADVVIRPLGGCTGAARLKFTGHQPQMEVVPGQWNPETSRTPTSAGRLEPRDMEPRAERWLKPAREFAGLSVWQPHAKVNTQKGRNGF